MIKSRKFWHPAAYIDRENCSHVEKMQTNALSYSADTSIGMTTRRDLLVRFQQSLPECFT